MYCKDSPRCQICFYGSNYYTLGRICNYIDVAGTPRKCPVENCDKFMPFPKSQKALENTMRELYDQGLNDRQIGESMGLATSTVNQWRKRAKLPSQTERRRKERKNET